MNLSKLCAYRTTSFLLKYIRAKHSDNTFRFLSTTPTDYEFFGSLASQSLQKYTTEMSNTQKKETERRKISAKLDDVRSQVIEMEVTIGITQRWEPSTPEYTNTLQYMATRDYQRALDKLQHLVILRLFELGKLNLTQTGKFNDYV